MYLLIVKMITGDESCHKGSFSTFIRMNEKQTFRSFQYWNSQLEQSTRKIKMLV